MEGLWGGLGVRGQRVGIALDSMVSSLGVAKQVTKQSRYIIQNSLGDPISIFIFISLISFVLLFSGLSA